MFKAVATFESFESIDAPALVTWVLASDEGSPQAILDGVLAELDKKSGGRLRAFASAGELTGKAGETLLLHAPPALKAQRLLLLGAGKADKFSLDGIRRLAGTAARFLKARGLSEFAFYVRSEAAPWPPADIAGAAVEGSLLGNFETGAYQTEKKDSKVIDSLQLGGFSAKEEANLNDGIRHGQVVAEAQNFARELANEPANRLTPRLFSDRAAAMAKKVGLDVDILDEKRLQELKMGAFLSVAQGSEEPPRLVVLSHTPEGWKDGQTVLGLVGKGVTFDSGGISIKPSEGMEKMKYDMSGAATMVAAMQALAALRPRTKVIAVVPLTENLPSGRAQKPGDVQVAMSGKSIEVVNTDAEGRLVLADALHYARQLGATHLVDAATLTGAVFVALGHVNVGAFTNNQAFLDRLLESSRAVGEKIWPLPLDDEYHDNITSSVADIQNVGKGRGGGAINGAMFLKEFVGDTPWVHLDIAGVAWLEEGKPWMIKGPSGVGVRTLVHLAERFNG